MLPLYIYDPTAQDSLSQVRGVGRYLEVLRENLTARATFVDNVKKVPYESVLVNPFFNVLGKPLVTKRVAKKQIAVIHDVIPLLYPAHFPTGIKAKYNLFLNQLTVKNYDLIITDCKKSRDDIVDVLGVAASKIKIVHPTVPSIFFDKKTSTGIPAGKKNSKLPLEYILYVGDVTWNKNISKIAKAAKIAEIACVCVGKAFTRRATLDSWDKEFMEFQRETDNEPFFLFPGFVSDEELLTYYQNALCTVLISRDEGFGFPYLEASTQSCPSLLSDIPVFHEVAGEAAVYAAPDSIQSVAQALKRLVETPTLRDELSKKSLKRAQGFLPAKFTKDFLKAVHS